MGVPVMSDGDTEAHLEALEGEIEQIKSQLGQLSVHGKAIESLAGLASDLLRLTRLSQRSADEDRAIMREMQSEMREMQTEIRGLQAENRQILEYLFGQQRNNGGGSR